MPIAWQERITRSAISPRLAIRILRNVIVSISTQSPVIHLRNVLEDDLAIIPISLKNPLKLREHRLVIRMALFRRIGRRKQPALHPLVIEDLNVFKLFQSEIIGAEEIADHIVVNPPVIDLLVIGRIVFKQLFVSDEKRRRGRDALIPDQSDPAPRPEDAGELRSGLFPL